MFVIKHRKIFYLLSALLIASAVAVTAIWGIKFGIDFTGGSILEVNFSDSVVEKDLVLENIKSLNIEVGDLSVRSTNETGHIVRTKNINDAEKNQILESLSILGQVEEIRFNNVGPTLGSELKSKAVVSVLVVILSIVIFVAFAFRHVSKPVSSWKYGLVAIVTFVHDVMIPVGVFAILGQFLGVEVDTLFIISILVVLGYSINDTIIVFDRIRENLKAVPEEQREQRFEQVVGKSLRQTFARSLNTSITTLITLTALFFLGGEATKWFTLALIAGILAGTYSSIFFAAPMLVTISKFKKKQKVEIVREI